MNELKEFIKVKEYGTKAVFKGGTVGQKTNNQDTCLWKIPLLTVY